MGGFDSIVEHVRHPGSVFTCLVAGRSVYGYVRKFLKTDGGDCPGYASVCWFGPPMYPRGSNRLEVVVSRDDSEIYREIGSCIIPITRIDPSMVVPWSKLTCDENVWLRHS